MTYGSLGKTTGLLPRVAPQMIGLGLIESMAADDILVADDPQDLDGDCTETQIACLEARHGAIPGDPEIVDELLELVTFYASSLAVPARGVIMMIPMCWRGKPCFIKLNALLVTLLSLPPVLMPQSTCAISSFGRIRISCCTIRVLNWLTRAQQATLQVLSGERHHFGAWVRTQNVSGHTLFLHDGRAQSIEEAILWHGGEGSTARDTFIAMTAR